MTCAFCREIFGSLLLLFIDSLCEKYARLQGFIEKLIVLMVGWLVVFNFVCLAFFCLHIQYINSFVKCIICDDELKRLIRITVAAPLFRIISMNRIFRSVFSIYSCSKWKNRHFLIFRFESLFCHFFRFESRFLTFFRFEHKKLKKLIPHLKTRKPGNFFYGAFDV